MPSGPGKRVAVALVLAACGPDGAGRDKARGLSDTAADSGSGSGGLDGGDAPVDLSCTAGRVWHQGDLTLATAAEADAFCDENNAVDGDLFVDQRVRDDAIQELDGLRCLCEVTGDLTLLAEPLGGPPPPHVNTDVELVSLETVGGDLVIQDYPGLTSVSELEALTDIGGDFFIDGTPTLGFIDLPPLGRIGGTLYIDGEERLEVIVLEGLTEAGGVSLGAETGLPWLRYLLMPNLARVDQGLALTRLAWALGTDFSALEQAGAVAVAGWCSSAPAFPALTTVAGHLRLEGNCALTDLSGIAAVSSAGQVTIRGNGGITAAALDGWAAGVEITGEAAMSPDDPGACDAWLVETYGVDREAWCPLVPSPAVPRAQAMEGRTRTVSRAAARRRTAPGGLTPRSR